MATTRRILNKSVRNKKFNEFKRLIEMGYGKTNTISQWANSFGVNANIVRSWFKKVELKNET